MSKSVRDEAKQNIVLLQETLASPVTESLVQEDTGSLSQKRSVSGRSQTLLFLLVVLVVDGVVMCRHHLSLFAVVVVVVVVCLLSGDKLCADWLTE